MISPVNFKDASLLQNLNDIDDRAFGICLKQKDSNIPFCLITQKIKGIETLNT